VHRSLHVGPTGDTPAAPGAFFHAGLTELDEKRTYQPKLAEALPQLGTDSWKVFPDGRMETTWRLRPNPTWHDGAPLVADDVVLSVQARIAYRTGGTRGGGATLARFIDEVTAPDPRTVVVRWKEPYPPAGESDWQPLPRHILGPALESATTPESFASLPYWSTEFVGLGPYRLERWEPGAFVEGVAFPGYVHGQPRIGRIQIVWTPDANTAVANLLSGTVHLATDDAVAFEQATILRREWQGSLLLDVNSVPYLIIQYKSDYVNPRALLDIRVRRALAHAVDKRALAEVMLDGEAGVADALVSPNEEYFLEVDRTVTKYPFDLRRTEQLMLEAGFSKDQEGFFAQTGTRPSTEIQGNRGSSNEREALILADGWKRAGIEAPIHLLSAAEALNNELISTFPAFRLGDTGVDNAHDKFRSDAIATAATRWSGGNRGGYSDPDYDRFYSLMSTSLDRNERNQGFVQGMKLLSDQAATFPLYYRYGVVAHAADLVGPRPGTSGETVVWKAEEWRWR